MKSAAGRQAVIAAPRSGSNSACQELRPKPQICRQEWKLPRSSVAESLSDYSSLTANVWRSAESLPVSIDNDERAGADLSMLINNLFSTYTVASSATLLFSLLSKLFLWESPFPRKDSIDTGIVFPEMGISPIPIHTRQ
jgi:hypothetical protein